ncbi:MAG: ATP-binding protein, partial [Thermodesulfobacteriota bacterium]|nr:ATP-binding protein [Thermodesulfobacteriota bacterium]
INAIMETALGIVENEFHLRHVHLRRELTEDMKKALLDENQIEQVFINILLNALQAVEDNGLVAVQTAVKPEQKRIHVEISDNGCGIAPDHLKKIFEPFFSTKANGTGLGLAVSYGIVENHQGDIRVFSEPGKGTRFIIEFPFLVVDSFDKGGA